MYREPRYHYDRAGRLTSGEQPLITERFAFDPAHNMLPAQANTTTPALHHNRLLRLGDTEYRYDRHGNLIEKRIGKHTHMRLTWNVEHQLEQARITRKEPHRHTRNTRRFHYHYDAFGRRLAKTGARGTTLFEWDGNRLLSEQQQGRRTVYLYEPGSFAPLAQLVDEANPSQPSVTAPGQFPVTPAANDDDDDIDWNPRQARQAFEQMMQRQQRLIREQMAQATRPVPVRPHLEPTIEVEPKTWDIRYYHTDHIGTSRELTSEDGEVLWSVLYQAWGNTLRETWLPEKIAKAVPLRKREEQIKTQNLTQHLRFQGQYFDEETGLHYNRFRYYDPDCGRFVSQDPIGLHGGANLYQYSSNPTEWVDPFGLKCIQRLEQKGRLIFDGLEVRAVRDLSHLSEGTSWSQESSATVWENF